MPDRGRDWRSRWPDRSGSTSSPPYRLRILTTELKRIARDGGDVVVRVQGGRVLPPRLLPGVFAVI